MNASTTELTGNEPFEVLAIRYSTNPHLRVSDSFLFHRADAHEQAGPMDFYFWLVRNSEHTVLVDTGFSEQAARERNRVMIETPVRLLEQIGQSPESIDHVVLTHLDYDHSGNIASFPQATIHLQDAEMAYATGRLMKHKHFRAAIRTEDVLTAVTLVHEGRVQYHDGDAEIVPGVSIHHLGGHTAGMQVVRVRTARGWVVLASDASHYYKNIRYDRPHPIALDLGKVLDGYQRCNELADSPDHIIPGHDPQVLACFPLLDGNPNVSRLDQPPHTEITPAVGGIRK